MLKVGEIVEIEGKNYKVSEQIYHELPCINCAMGINCTTGGLTKLKEIHEVKSCTELIPIHSRFEKVELVLQVIYKYKT